MSESQGAYFIPDPSRWPIVATVILFITFIGAATLLNGSAFGTFILGIGVGGMVYMLKAVPENITVRWTSVFAGAWAGLFSRK